MSPRPKRAAAPKEKKRSPRGEAIAKSRREGTLIRQYLEALEQQKPKRGRKRTPESVRRQLEQVEERLADANPLDRVELVQQRIDLQNELVRLEAPDVDVEALEEQFVDVARSYSDRKGISYAAWREVGVQPGVLKRAGITRASR